MVDVIILTDSKDPKMTQETIDSLINSLDVRIILTCKRADYRIYKNINTYVILNEEFNYNKFLNESLKHVINDWVLISNDDVIYNISWYDEIKKVTLERPDITSFSPMDPRLHEKYYNTTYSFKEFYVEGYNVTEHISGWSILVKKSTLDTIGKFDETFDMYYQDNDYAQNLLKHGFKHALVKSSIAYHKSTEFVELPYSQEKVLKLAEDEYKFRSKWNIWK